MGHARGVLLMAVRRANIPLLELRPTEIKKSLTGFGHAGKGQMQSAIKYEFSLAVEPKPADAADGLAIALAALRRRELEPASNPPKLAKS
jgi:crossover junction endodeoxyribonuclease RuvC